MSSFKIEIARFFCRKGGLGGQGGQVKGAMVSKFEIVAFCQNGILFFCQENIRMGEEG